MPRRPAAKSVKSVQKLKYDADKRKNIPTAELQSVLNDADQKPVESRYARNRDLDPQLVWLGKDEQDWSDLVVQAPPLNMKGKVHVKALTDDLLRKTTQRAHDTGILEADLFSDSNGMPKGADKTDFCQHDPRWTNRTILVCELEVRP